MKYLTMPVKRRSIGMVQTTFDSTKEALNDLLGDAGTGKLQLPDFQRGWVWDDYSIRSLLASISQAFPFGVS